MESKTSCIIIIIFLLLVLVFYAVYVVPQNYKAGFNDGKGEYQMTIISDLNSKGYTSIYTIQDLDLIEVQLKSLD